MKKIFLFLIILSSCKSSTLQEEAILRIQYYEKVKNNYFINTSIRSFREIYNPKTLDFEVIKIGKPSYAVIQTMPENYVFKNFYEDSLSIDFVNTFAQMNCRKLYNKDDFDFFEFIYKKQKVTVFKGIPNYVNFHYDIKKGVDLLNDWKYLVEEFKGEN